ncbi:MAG: glycosyltransferase [Opitutales bacterium]
MNVAFTICSINYLAHAVALGNSLQLTNPQVDFRIYLVDRLQGRKEIEEKVPFPVIEIEKVPVTDFDGMCRRYNLIELNTAVKPFIFEHILKSENSAENIIYFDPDIIVFEELEVLYDALRGKNMVLTPHLLSPCDGSYDKINEGNFLNTGIFNLGFLAIRRSGENRKFLDWWKERLVHQGHANHTLRDNAHLYTHLFYDQKWMNFAPVFFEGVIISKHYGMNMAAWNLHERKLNHNQATNSYSVNDQEKLIFYHFSGIKPFQEEEVSSHSKLTFNDRPDLRAIITNYREQLLQNNYEYFKQFACSYSKLDLRSANSEKKQTVENLDMKAKASSLKKHLKNLLKK